jgi:hypothetical protein
VEVDESVGARGAEESAGAGGAIAQDGADELVDDEHETRMAELARADAAQVKAERARLAQGARTRAGDADGEAERARLVRLTQRDGEERKRLEAYLTTCVRKPRGSRRPAWELEWAALEDEERRSGVARPADGRAAGGGKNRPAVDGRRGVTRPLRPAPRWRPPRPASSSRPTSSNSRVPAPAQGGVDAAQRHRLGPRVRRGVRRREREPRVFALKRRDLSWTDSCRTTRRGSSSA